MTPYWPKTKESKSSRRLECSPCRARSETGHQSPAVMHQKSAIIRPLLLLYCVYSSSLFVDLVEIADSMSKSPRSWCLLITALLQLLLLLPTQLVAAHTHHQQKLAFFSFAYGTALEFYGWMSVASALLTFDDISTYFIYCDDNSTLPAAFNILVPLEKQKKLKFIRSIQNVSTTYNGDSNLAQVHIIRDALKTMSTNYSDHHVVYHDMDVLFFQRQALDEVFHKLGHPFEIGLGTRTGGKYGATNIGILLFHAAKLQRAYALAELLVSIYGDENLHYRELQKASGGHFCCAQHVFQHAIELIFQNISWQQTQQDLTYFHTEDVRVKHIGSLDLGSSGRHIFLRRAANSSTYEQCVSPFVSVLSKDFTMLSLAWRVFIPSPQTSDR
ncbi:hypothetical protein EON65_56410, partial [archaeon]